MKKYLFYLLFSIFLLFGTNISYAGNSHVCGFLVDGELKCIGDNSYGQINVPELLKFKYVSTGGYNTCGITIDDELKCWGNNVYGQLNIPSGFNWKSISLGLYHTCGITTDDELKCWGNNFRGQINVPTGFNWESVTLGGYNTCGITTDKEKKCWGYFDSIPVSNYKNIYYGFYQSCGITTSDKLICWNSNTTSTYNLPQGYVSNKISIGHQHVCGLSSNDDLKCWGNNYNGETNVPGSYNWEDVTTGIAYTCGITTDNKLKCWGSNSYVMQNVSSLYSWKSFTENTGLIQVTIPVPTLLNQYIKSPLLEQEEVTLGSNIGKFQSGSGVILEAGIENNTENEYNLVFDIYRIGLVNPQYTEKVKIKSGTGRVIVPYLGAGDYMWEVRVEDENGNKSEEVGFGGNYSFETDYSIYEGFEPYPYGFSFPNAKPDFSLLTGSGVYKYNYIDGTVTMGKTEGTKWEIFDKVFPIEYYNGDMRKYLDTFESFGLNNDEPSKFNYNCFGYAISALTQLYKSEILGKSFPVFSDSIGDGYIYDNLKINVLGENGNYTFEGLDEKVKTILALQLYQYDYSYNDKRELSFKNDKAIGVLNKVKENPGKYVLSFNGKTLCDHVFNIICFTDKGHAVVPYRVEGNRIYIWDNNTPYPYIENEYGKNIAYDKYIEIDVENNTFSVPGYKWDIFTDIGVVSIDEAYSETTSPIGFNNVDTLYTLSGSSDILLIDTNGNKTGYQNGETFEEIPGTKIMVSYNGDSTENTWKQIYLPEKIDNLKVEINGTTEENYNLMIAGGDYYSKIEGVNTNSGQIDIFEVNREKVKIDFDDNKTGSYNLLVNDYQNSGTGTIYINDAESKIEPQQYIVNWTGVIENTSDSVIYELDTNSDGIYDDSINLPPIYQDNTAPTTTHTISGNLNTNTTNSYIENVTIDLNSIDNENGTGVDKIYYAIGTDTGSLVYVEYTEPVLLNGVGDYTLNYYSKDKFGNTEEVKSTNFSLTEKPETYAGNISGYVYDDSNQNGIQDNGEKYMAGWKICIDKNNNNDCEENIEPFNVTNNDGYYEFDSLITGSYKILEIPHQNWVVINPTIGYYNVNLSNGQVVTNKNFGNFKIKGNNK